MTATAASRAVGIRRTDGHRLWQRHGRDSDAVWARPALAALLAATAALYIIGLGRSGWANEFYSAAAAAGTKSWKAMFFGSFDASSFITVDKPPASLWVSEISARIFGVNSWSLLVPQALEGVAATGLLYTTVKRWFGPGAGLLAGAVLAATPAAALMFRFNNPDALLVLLIVAAAYAVTRAIEDGRTRWLVLAGSLVGFGFLTKMLQALLVLPAFGIAYLVAGPPALGRRVWQVAAGGVATLVAAGWWVAIVQLTPASARPYIGGSTTNSVLQL
ncbi:MAG TPA: glycosyltransferase family 39 protein, partial [Streptosporangiaceae bacterium]|nr:glycosyltransferase family 39 protein [Streptosporangiaceae bacterium]